MPPQPTRPPYIVAFVVLLVLVLVGNRSTNEQTPETVLPKGTSDCNCTSSPLGHDRRPICMSGADWYGRSFNRFITLAHLVKFAEANGNRPIRVTTEHYKWITEWLDLEQPYIPVNVTTVAESSSSSTSDPNESQPACFDTKSPQEWYDWARWNRTNTELAWIPLTLRRNFFVKGAQAFREYKERYAKEQQAQGHDIAPENVRTATVHSRWLEGSCLDRMERLAATCDNITGVLPTDKQWHQEICSYTESYVRRQLNDRGYANESTVIILFADGQQRATESTFSYRDSHTYHVQVAMTIMSDIHFGVPASSADFVMAHWRQGRPLFPEMCYQSIVQSYQPWWQHLLTQASSS